LWFPGLGNPVQWFKNLPVLFSPHISPFGKKLEDASILLSIASIVERDNEDTC